MDADDVWRYTHIVEPRASSNVTTKAEDACTVVLVEDLADYVLMTKTVFELDGHTVHTATTGRTGIELIRRVRPDIAFVDIGLPDGDGYTVAKTLRTEGNQIFLVALTAYGGDRTRSRAAEAGFDRHILKPLLPHERYELVKLARDRCRPAL